MKTAARARAAASGSSGIGASVGATTTGAGSGLDTSILSVRPVRLRVVLEGDLLNIEVAIETLGGASTESAGACRMGESKRTGKASSTRPLAGEGARPA